MIQIEHDARYGRFGAVLAGAHPADTIHANLFFYSVWSDGAGKVEENAVWIYRGLNRRLNGRAKRHFHAQVGAVGRRGHVFDLYRDLHGRGAACALRCRATH